MLNRRMCKAQYAYHDPLPLQAVIGFPKKPHLEAIRKPLYCARSNCYRTIDGSIIEKNLCLNGY